MSFLLSDLSMHNWRCFKQSKFRLPVNKFAIIDENGSGKSSVLSAVYSLYTGKAFPGTRFSQSLQIGQSYFGLSTDRQDWFITGKLASNNRIFSKIEIPKEFKQVNILTYQPTDNYWLFQTRSQKLNILDDVIGNKVEGYSQKIEELTKLTKSKSELIKHSIYSQSNDIVIAQSFTKKILDLSRQIWVIRLQFLSIFSEQISEFNQWINCSHKSWNIEIKLTNSAGKKVLIRDLADVNKVFDQLELNDMQYTKLWNKELTCEKVLFGAHRDDFEILVDNIKLQAILSRGEMRLFVLFFKKQAIRKDCAVLWLVDDIFNELDQTREQILVREILNDSDYLIATGTRPQASTLAEYSLEDLKV